MPSANTAMTNADGSVKTNASGALVVSDSSGGGCGPTLPCCDGLLLCAPPNVLPGSVNVQTVMFDEVHERTGQPTIEKHLSESVNIGCGTFGWTPSASNVQVERAEVLANWPSSPGLKRWVMLRFGDSGTLGQIFTIFWRPEATWWSWINGLDQANPSSPGLSVVASISPCGRSATFEYTNTLGPPNLHTTWAVTIEGSLLPCPSSADSGCSDCGDEGLSPA